MKQLFCLLAFLCPFLGWSQTSPVTHITGSVYAPDKTPLAGAVITLQHKRNPFLADSKGRFDLTLSRFPDTLRVTNTGYFTKTILLTRGMALPLLIELLPKTTTLDEVVVSTGYQDIPKERATGSFVKIDKELFNRRTSTNVLDRLEGVTPGLLFNRNTIATSKRELDINVRGHSTLFSNDQPLVVVDNFPYDSDINNLNPNDVESITLLKDAAAASIWGVKAGNGVLVITTKKGRQNQRQSVSLSANTTIGNRPDLYYDPNYLRSSDFIDIEDSLFNRGYYNADFTSADRVPVSPVVDLLHRKQLGLLSSAQAEEQINALRQLDARDQLSHYLYQPSFNQQYALNISGGNTVSDYYFSAGFDRNRSNAVGNSHNRTVLTGRYNLSLTPALKLSFGGNYTQSDDKNNSLGSLSTGGPYARKLAPYSQLADADGNALSIVKDFSSAYTDTAGAGLLADWKYRPLDELSLSDNRSASADIRFNFGLDYSFSSHLHAQVKYQYEKGQSDTRNYYSDQTYYTRNLLNTYASITNGIVTNPIPSGGVLDTRNSQFSSSRGRLQLNYANTFQGPHSLTAIAGTEASEVISANSSQRLYGYDDELASNNGLIDYAGLYKWYYNKGRSGRIANPDDISELTDRYISWFANAAYSYHSRYTLSLSGRIDKSNLFGVATNQKAVPLYSTGFAWDLSKESFYKVSWLPYVKLRATLGYSGNTNKTVTGYTTALINTLGTYSRYPASSIINPGNPDLRWEKVRMWNFGIDFGSKGGILTGSIEYYLKKGIGLIGSAPIAPSSGFTTFQGNVAGTTGQGFDLVLNSLNHNSKWKWTTQWILSRALDKVSSYDVKSSPATYILYGNGNAGQIFPLLDKPLFAIYSYPWVGLDPATGNPMGILNGSASTDYTKILSQTTVDNMILSGNARPAIFGSIRNSFSWRSFTLSFNLVYKLDYVFRRSSINYASLFQNWQGNMDYYARWQKPGDELLTDIPSLQFPPVNNNREQFYSNASVLVEKGDHIRLQDIQLSYNWTPTSKKHFPFQSLKAYAYLNNLGILWRANKKGLDPDLFTGNLPFPASFTLGLNLNF